MSAYPLYFNNPYGLEALSVLKHLSSMVSVLFMNNESPERRLSMCWNRLPAFRAVAATEHLPTASKLLHVTAPALSRTIRLLEEDFGQPLFERVGRRIVLNQAGRELLASLQDTMSRLEGTFRDLGEDPMVGRVRLSTVGVLTDHLVLPAVLALCQEHPNFEPELVECSSREANDLIVRGALDLAFYFDGVSDDRLVIERLGSVAMGVYCGAGHPLFGQPAADLETLLAHPFAVLSAGDRESSVDGWPAELKRKVGMRVTTLSTKLRATLSGAFLAVLPDRVARAESRRGTLMRFESELVAPRPIFAANRRNDGTLCPSCIIKHEVADVITGATDEGASC